MASTSPPAGTETSPGGSCRDVRADSSAPGQAISCKTFFTCRAGCGSSRKGRDARPVRVTSRRAKRSPSSVLPLAARKPRLDLLEQPPVAVRIAERGIRLVGAALRVWAWNPPPGEVKHLAHLGAA